MGARFLATAIVLAFLARCSQFDGGAGGETTNGIVGSIRNHDDTPAANSIVKLFPDGYDPVTDDASGAGFIDTADANGTYRFRRIASGSYTVLARNRKAATCFLKSNVAVCDDSVTTVPAGILNGSGSVTADFSLSGVVAEGYIYIPGTDISSPIGSDGSVFLADVPPGAISVVILASDGNEKRNILRDGIIVTSGDTVTIEQPLWKYSRNLVLNTTASGAEVPGDLYGFPVLVRLDGENFDFSQADAHGADIRFSTGGGVSLSYEIERWDRIAERAEVWVKVDTIRGNDEVQSITIYWGNSGATDHSNSAAVFDTTAGFQGVWHMGQKGNTTVFDATANRIDGTPIGMKDGSLVEGMIGGAQRFDDTTNYILLSGSAEGTLNFPQNGTYTLSAWVNTEVIDSLAHYIISKSTYSYSLLISKTQRWELYDVEDGVGLQSVYAEPSLKEWKLLTGVCDGDDMRLYVDGACIDSVREIKPGLAFDPTFDVHIGKRADSESYGCWYGMLDEVRVANVALSADWIKLCYMNQRKDDRLIVFK